MNNASRTRWVCWATMMLLAPTVASGQQAGMARERLEVVRRRAVPVERTLIARSVRIGDATCQVLLEIDQPPRVDPEPVEPEPPDDFEEVDEAEPAQAQAPAQARIGMRLAPARTRLAPETFDQFIYGERTRPQARRADLERALRVRIDAASRAFRLGEADRQKLLLAGQGDIKHTLDRIEAARVEFESARAKYQDGIKVLERSAGLAVEARKPFGLGSLYGKTLNTIAVAPGMGRVAP